MKRERSIVIAVGASLLLATAHCGGTSRGGRTSGDGAPHAAVSSTASPEAPARTYTLKNIERWTRTQATGYETFTDPDGEIRVHVLETSEGDLGKAIESAIARVGRKPGLIERRRASGAPDERFQEILVVTLTNDGDEHVTQAIAYKHATDASRVYVFVVDGPTKSVSKRGAEVQRIMSSLEVEGAERLVVDVENRKPFDQARQTALLAFIEQARERSGVPGLAVAVVTPEGTVTRGFGTREQGGAKTVDADTQFMIGSITKSFSTLLLATLVDDGKLRWEQPAAEAYPEFRLADAARTQDVQMQHLFCACTGAPRQDMELIFEFSKVAPKDVFREISKIPLTTAFGETFQYNNQLTAAGGFIAGRIAEPSVKEPGAAFSKALRARVLDKAGMSDTVLEVSRVQSRGNYALPHGIELDASTSLVPLTNEGFVTPIAPAGALWSTANDMAKYIELQLGHGQMKNGTRVVSEANLTRTQTSQVAVSNDVGYGLGWAIGKQRGLTVIEHSGGTIGFNSDVAFFPELGVGLFIVGNRSPTPMTREVRERLLELLFDLPAKVEGKHVHNLAEMKRSLVELSAKASKDPVAAELMGTYHNDRLGTVVLKTTPKGAMLDAGEWMGRLAVFDPKERPNTLLLLDGLLKGLTFQVQTKEGKKSLLLTASQSDYVFTRR